MARSLKYVARALKNVARALKNVAHSLKYVARSFKMCGARSQDEWRALETTHENVAHENVAHSRQSERSEKVRERTTMWHGNVKAHVCMCA